VRRPELPASATELQGRCDITEHTQLHLRARLIACDRMSIWAMHALDKELEVDPEHPQRITGRHASQLDEKPTSLARPTSRCATRCHAVEGLAALLDTIHYFL
jgi:hypothetical protein